MLAERRIKKREREKGRKRKITWLILFHVLEEAPESVGRILVTRVRGLIRIYQVSFIRGMIASNVDTLP